MEAALGANEWLVTRHKHRETGVICKLDLEKSFDSVKWTFGQFHDSWDLEMTGSNDS